MLHRRGRLEIGAGHSQGDTTRKLHALKILAQITAHGPLPAPRLIQPVTGKARHEKQRLLNHLLRQAHTEAGQTRHQPGRLRFASGEQLVEITVFVELLFALGKESCRKLRRIPFAAELLAQVDEIHQIVQLLDPPDYFPAGIVFLPEGLTHQAEIDHRQPHDCGRARIMFFEIVTEFVEETPHGFAELMDQR